MRSIQIHVVLDVESLGFETGDFGEQILDVDTVPQEGDEVLLAVPAVLDEKVFTWQVTRRILDLTTKRVAAIVEVKPGILNVEEEEGDDETPNDDGGDATP